jgi:regulator of RNase E activity RraA
MHSEISPGHKAPPLTIPVRGSVYTRTPREVLERLGQFGTGTAVSILYDLGLRHTTIDGPMCLTPGRRIAGNALTLQFMPQREDFSYGAGEQEERERETALWSVLESASEGDILVVQAYGDRRTGCIGEMLTTHFLARGGIGLVVDGCVRDWPRVQKLNVPVWACGVTPNFASQSGLQPWAYNVPVACGRVLVLPGDVVLADDDGAVVIPAQFAELVADHALEHEEEEVFSRLRLAAGGELKRYYPLSEEGKREFEEWRRSPRASAASDGSTASS